MGSKYKNKRVTVDGIKFDSKKEANRYRELKLLEQAGKISNLQLQKPFMLTESYCDDSGKRVRASFYKADFVYCRNGKTIAEDVKGFKTELYKLKKKLVHEKYGLDIKEI